MNLRVRRHINYLERLLYNALENMYVCDYLDEDSFFQAVEWIIHEFWNFGSDEVLDKLEWEDVQELLDNYFDVTIRDFYNERKEGCEKSDELTEYPNFVYESTEDLPNKIKRRISMSDELWKDLFYSVDVMDFIDFSGWFEDVMNLLAYVNKFQDFSDIELDQIIKYFENDPKVIRMAQDNYLKRLSHDNIPYAVFEITKPLAHMPMEYYYQEAPLWKTQESIIFIKKGAVGTKSISTNNIKVLKVFPEGDTKELEAYLEELRSKVR